MARRSSTKSIRIMIAIIASSFRGRGQGRRHLIYACFCASSRRSRHPLPTCALVDGSKTTVTCRLPQLGYMSRDSSREVGSSALAWQSARLGQAACGTRTSEWAWCSLDSHGRNACALSNQGFAPCPISRLPCEQTWNDRRDRSSLCGAQPRNGTTLHPSRYRKMRLS
jgi:hypothetical protein